MPKPRIIQSLTILFCLAPALAPIASAQQLELYSAMATPITHRATSFTDEFEPRNLGLTLGGRWHVNPSWFVAAEVAFLQD